MLPTRDQIAQLEAAAREAEAQQDYERMLTLLQQASQLRQHPLLDDWVPEIAPATVAA